MNCPTCELPAELQSIEIPIGDRMILSESWICLLCGRFDTLQQQHAFADRLFRGD
jgi:hypothetical protein